MPKKQNNKPLNKWYFIGGGALVAVLVAIFVASGQTNLFQGYIGENVVVEEDPKASTGEEEQDYGFFTEETIAAFREIKPTLWSEVVPNRSRYISVQDGAYPFSVGKAVLTFTEQIELMEKQIAQHIKDERARLAFIDDAMFLQDLYLEGLNADDYYKYINGLKEDIQDMLDDNASTITEYDGREWNYWINEYGAVAYGSTDRCIQKHYQTLSDLADKIERIVDVFLDPTTGQPREFPPEPGDYRYDDFAGCFDIEFKRITENDSLEEAQEKLELLLIDHGAKMLSCASETLETKNNLESALQEFEGQSEYNDPSMDVMFDTILTTSKEVTGALATKCSRGDVTKTRVPTGGDDIDYWSYEYCVYHSIDDSYPGIQVNATNPTCGPGEVPAYQCGDSYSCIPSY